MKSKIISLLLTVFIIAMACAVPIYASNPAEPEYDWNACASDVRQAYLLMSEEESDTNI